MKKIIDKIYKVLVKLDYKTFKHVEKIILSEVKKSKYKQHKYQIMKKFHKANFAVFVLFIFIIYNLITIFDESSHKVFNLILHNLIWTPMLFFLFIKKIKPNRFEESYTYMFNQRKVPEVYNLVKHFCKKFREELRPLRIKFFMIRVIILAVFFPVLLMLSFAGGGYLYFICFTAWFSFDMYIYIFSEHIESVFDFDPPSKKEKAKEGVSELVEKQLKNLILAMKPGTSSI